MAQATHHVSVFLSANAGTFNGVMIAAGRSVSGLSRDLEKAEKAGTTMSTMMRAGLASAAVVLSVALAASIKSAIDFEVQMRNVNSISKLSEETLAGLSRQVLELSTRVPQSANTLAKALYEIASSGFQGAEGFEILEASAISATAGMSDANTAAKAIVAVINAYGLEAKDASYVSDVLFKTVELGITTFGELAGQIGDVIGSASVATVSIEELGAAFATITLSGISPAETATSLNRLIQKIINPSTELSRVLGLLGYESGVQALRVDKLNVVMDKLRVLSGGNLSVIREWFPEIRAARGALALMAAGGQNMSRVWEDMSTSEKIAGATDAAFAEQMKATGNQLKLFGNQIQAAAIIVASSLLGSIKDIISGLQDFGGKAIPIVKSAINALKPFWHGMRDAIDDIVEILKNLWETAGPTAKAILGLAVGAVLVFFNTLGSVLSSVTGFMRDHQGVVQLLVAAYVGLVSARALGGMINWAGRAGASLGELMTKAQNTTLAFSNLRTMMMTAGPQVFLTAGLAAITATATEYDKAHKAAQRLIDTVKQDIEVNNIASMQEALARLRGEYHSAAETANEYKGIGDLFKEYAGLLTPLENPGLRAAIAVDDVGRAIVDLADDIRFSQSAVDRIGESLGLSDTAVRSLADSIQLDLAVAWRTLNADGEVTSEEIGILAGKIQAAADAAANGTPTTDALGSSFGTIADAASSATDQVDAFKSAMDALIGIHISSIEAAVKLENQFADLTGAILMNGASFDITTEAGRDNMTALTDLASAALSHAEAVARETGSVEAGNEALFWNRERLKQTLVQMGLTEQAADDLLTTMGLTPESLETLVQLNGVEAAEAALEALAGQLTNTDGLTATGYAIMDFSSWQAGMDAMQAQILNFAHTQPTSTLYVDDEPAKVKMSTIMAALRLYGEQSPEAQALLQYAPAEEGFNTLQEWIDWYSEQSPEARAELDSEQAKTEMDILFLELGRYDMLSPEAKALLDTSGADFALAILQRHLDDLDGRVVSTYVIEKYYRTPSTGPDTGTTDRLFRRWGGIDYAYANGGVTPAHVQRGETIKYAEPETGGEAYIPRRGNPRRSLAILGAAAGWYGHRVTPMAAGGIATSAVSPGMSPSEASWRESMNAMVQVISASAAPLIGKVEVNGTNLTPEQAFQYTASKIAWKVSGVRR